MVLRSGLQQQCRQARMWTRRYTARCQTTVSFAARGAYNSDRGLAKLNEPVLAAVSPTRFAPWFRMTPMISPDWMYLVNPTRSFLLQVAVIEGLTVR